MKLHVVLSRKWRPQRFSEVVGQDHVITTLQNSLATGRVAHAYLFSGPRGTGKTTVARILAKAVNCLNLQNPQVKPEPCNECLNCKNITSGRTFDVIEMDAASSRGIDQIRDLRENVKLSPSGCRYKVYIIDEVHMLTPEAFNALLKTLEEPPQHVIFILATTEKHKVLETITSRCLQFNFRRLSYNEIARRIGIAVGTVATRINNLEKQGVIKGYSTIVDAEKVGYDVVAVIEVTVSRGKITEVEEEVAKNAYNTAIFTAYNVKYAVLLGDERGVRELIVQVMRDPDVVYAIVYDADGKPIAEMFRGGRGLYPIDKLQDKGLDTVSRLLRDEEGRKILEIITPIVASRLADPERFVNKELFGFSEGETILDEMTQSVRIGTVRLGMTFDNAKGRVKHILLSGTGFFLAITFGGSFLTLLLFNKFFVSPLERMARTTRRIAAGNLSRRVEEKGSWEIATFARAFNEMVERVQKTIAELEKLNDKLRREINEKDDFLRAVSHDLSAPLRNIAGMVSLLQRRYGESLDQRASDWLNRIVKNVEHDYILNTARQWEPYIY